MVATLKYEDLMGGQPAAAESAEPAEESGGQEFFELVRSFNLEVQQTVQAVREVIQLIAELRGGASMQQSQSPYGPVMSSDGPPGAGYGPSGPGGGAPFFGSQQSAGPDPKTFIVNGLRDIQAESGDLTMLELLNMVMRQYGGLRISDILSRLG